MSESSSSEEDVRLLAAAVDPTFLNQYRAEAFGDTGNVTAKAPEQRKSERHLVVESHYNDVRVPAELQRRVAAKLSRLIESSVEFVAPSNIKVKKRKIKGGVKLFSTSESYLSTVVAKDTATEEHNENSRKLQKKRKQRRVSGMEEEPAENEKVRMASVTAEHVVCGEETRHWKSRRKEKLFKYKSKGKGKVLISVD